MTQHPPDFRFPIDCPLAKSFNNLEEVVLRNGLQDAVKGLRADVDRLENLVDRIEYLFKVVWRAIKGVGVASGSLLALGGVVSGALKLAGVL